jgi:DnaJ-domain-containing protein 1
MRQMIEIPEFLLEMSKQMHEQDNRLTADPVWQVRCNRFRVTDSEYSDHYQIIKNDEGYVVFDSESDDDLQECLDDYRSEFSRDWEEVNEKALSFFKRSMLCGDDWSETHEKQRSESDG